MIIESILQAFLNVVGALITTATGFIGRPPDATFYIPSPFFDIFSQFLTNAGASIPALVVFYLWRQAKS